MKQHRETAADLQRNPPGAAASLDIGQGMILTQGVKVFGRSLTAYDVRAPVDMPELDSRQARRRR